MSDRLKSMTEGLQAQLDPFSGGNHRDPPGQAPEPERVFIEILKPSEIVAYEPPEGVVLIGDNHIVRGSVFVIGGPPGVGKSRATVAMAEAGATQFDWFGMEVHSKFRTLIVQNENGRYRLKLEFADLKCDQLDDYVRITPPPPFGLAFDREEFRDQLAAYVELFDPGVVIIDPWNAAVRDDKAKDYLETFQAIRSVIPPGDEGPALGIVPHTRKPHVGERANGRALLNLLAGSHILGSIPRCVFVLQSASDDVTDQRVVWTCCKNNDGELGPRSVWERCNGLFTPVTDFDWQAFDANGGKDEGPTWEAVAGIVEELEGQGQAATKKAVADVLKERGASKSAAYRHLETAERRGAVRLNKRTHGYELH